MPLLSLDAYTEKQNRAAQRVLDTLDRLESRTDTVYRDERRHERRQFRGTAEVRLPDRDGQIDPLNPVTCRVWARCISQGGLSFIHPDRLKAQKCLVGIELPDGRQAWFQADIVRAREVPGEEFWEYGVAFRGRAEV